MIEHDLLTLARWHGKLEWPLYLPLVLAGNVIVATLAWCIVGQVLG
jgi:hypothetical protein